uniref:Uncharacterized protein n=1 Tax=Arundo donax TaxID=35708 RepID=A0A0A9G076_ARUDO
MNSIGSNQLFSSPPRTMPCVDMKLGKLPFDL